MFCNSCGTPVQSNDFLCPGCGAPQGPRRAVIYPKDKIEGWLFFFCLWAAVINPVGILLLLRTVHTPLFLFLNVSLLALGILAGAQVWRRSPQALRYVALLLGGFVIIGAYFGVRFVVIGVTRSNLKDAAWELAIFQSLRLMALALAWWLYFRKSERVKAVFGRNL